MNYLITGLGMLIAYYYLFPKKHKTLRTYMAKKKIKVNKTRSYALSLFAGTVCGILLTGINQVVFNHHIQSHIETLKNLLS